MEAMAALVPGLCFQVPDLGLLGATVAWVHYLQGTRCLYNRKHLVTVPEDPWQGTAETFQASP